MDTVFALSEIMDQNLLIVTSLETEMQKKIPFLMDHLWEIIVSSDTVESPIEENLENLENLMLSFPEGFRDAAGSSFSDSAPAPRRFCRTSLGIREDPSKSPDGVLLHQHSFP
ncbi:hypothetical protein F5882DRAFT_462851 [Hyaloscypha sp. PMI_1271]|nr:hypothetical protein F5882DRAFT_462851 [Hyaloscypha sp. PMI_1271]